MARSLDDRSGDRHLRPALPCAGTLPVAARRAPGIVGLAAWALAAAPAAQAASSASFQINNAVLDASGGTSGSASFVVSACVGSEIAGSQASANHRIDSGCGPSALAIAGDFPLILPTPIPALSEVALGLLAALVAAAAMRRLRGSRR